MIWPCATLFRSWPRRVYPRSSGYIVLGYSASDDPLYEPFFLVAPLTQHGENNLSACVEYSPDLKKVSGWCGFPCVCGTVSSVYLDRQRRTSWAMKGRSFASCATILVRRLRRWNV